MTRSKLYGVGINDADYAVTRSDFINGKRKRVWTCPYYMRWANMLKRCYNRSYQETQPTYVGCVVCEDWIYFSKFKAWMETQDWEGKQLDKDLLSTGNVYCPESCVFVSSELNKLLGDCRKARGEYPLGVYWDKERGLFCSQMTECSDHIYLGRFTDMYTAHRAWQVAKRNLLLRVSKVVDDSRVENALLRRVSLLDIHIESNKVTEAL